MATQTEAEAGAGSKRKPRKTVSKAQKRRRKEAALVEKVIETFEEKLNSNELKPTVGDLIRLLQLEKELEEEQPKEIKVLWVEPSEKEPASGT
jgi:hypothetical protein